MSCLSASHLAVANVMSSYITRARELAQARIVKTRNIARRVGNDVALYHSLEGLVRTWIETTSEAIMPADRFARTDSVRGMVSRVQAIIRSGQTSSLEIPRIVLENWRQSLQVRLDVAEHYIKEQKRRPDPELEVANERHRFYRASHEECLDLFEKFSIRGSGRAVRA